jgi:hypothetical protein
VVVGERRRRRRLSPPTQLTSATTPQAGRLSPASMSEWSRAAASRLEQRAALQRAKQARKRPFTISIELCEGIKTKQNSRRLRRKGKEGKNPSPSEFKTRTHFSLTSLHSVEKKLKA